MFSYLDNKGHPRFEFTTVLSKSDEHAAATIIQMHANDYGLAIIQIVPSNGVSTGYTPEDSDAAVAEYASRVNEAGEPVD